MGKNKLDEDHVDDIEEYDQDEDVSFFDDDFDIAADVPDRYSVPEIEDLLNEAMEILASARPLPMSATVKVNRDELLLLLEQIQDQLPEELRAATWLLKERDDFVAKAKQEHKDLVEEGRQQVSRMIEREQVVLAAELRAREIVEDARNEANTMRRKVEEFCDERLASIEAIMERTIATMQQGRRRLLASDQAISEEDIVSSFSEHDDLDIDLIQRSVMERGY